MSINETNPITDHFDGFGLNDAIAITRDERDTERGGNASHHYTFTMNGKCVGTLQFQHGPRNEDGSVEGLTDAAPLVAVLDRYRGFQSGPFRCRENAIVITKLEEALLWMKKRAFDRAAQGVLGKNQPHTQST